MSSNSNTGNAEDDKRTSDLLALLYPEENAEVDAASFENDGELAGMLSLRAMLADVSDEEPSAATSNKLLALAAQHAPVAKAESRGVFAWLGDLLTPFLAHPGLAAAATLVLVVGVAGTLYIKGGAKIAEPTASSRSVDPESVSAPSPELAADPVVATEATEESEGESADMPGKLDDMLQEESAAVQQKAAPGYLPAEAPDGPKGGSAGTRGLEKKRSKSKAVVGGAASGRDSLSLADEVEDRGASPRKRSAADADRDDTPRRVKDIDMRDLKRPRDEPAPTSSAPAKAPSRTSKAETASPAAAQQEKDTQSNRPLALHQQARAAAKSNNCNRVHELGREIRKLDSAYYDSRFATDDSLKSCRQSGTKGTSKKSKRAN